MTVLVVAPQVGFIKRVKHKKALRSQEQRKMIHRKRDAEAGDETHRHPEMEISVVYDILACAKTT